MQHIYVYDGSYLALLSLILELIKRKIKPDNIKLENYEVTLFDEVINLQIEYDPNILKKMHKSFGRYATNAMYYVFLSEEENKELLLYYFFLNALKYHKNIGYKRNLKCVSEVLRISQYVMHEGHKMKGFLRFKELENKVLYAEMEPTNDVIMLVSEHFQKRLKNEYFIIKDVGRGILSIYDKQKFVIVPEDNFILSTSVLSDEEKKMEQLWKIFYRTIGIESRKNDRCRMNFMPKKYWKHIIEMEDEL
ncbi:MAG: TIGR03915 family putative DNA repair protein [Bacilli bacterium]|nr:TIGR03915 family putative DNA repair protein [Bacilli bacterium]